MAKEDRVSLLPPLISNEASLDPVLPQSTVGDPLPSYCENKPMSHLAEIRTADVKLVCNILPHKALSAFQQQLMTEAPRVLFTQNRRLENKDSAY